MKVPTFVTERVEVIVREMVHLEKGPFRVIVRDGTSQVTTFEGDNEEAVRQAEILHSIFAAMRTRLTKQRQEA